jgi:hypothetical protein
MKVYLLFFTVSACLFLSGCMHCVQSNIGNKILEDNREFDMAPEYLATEFYEDEKFVYFKAPIQTFREIYPGAAAVFLEGYFETSNIYYPLSPIQKRSVILRRNKTLLDRWFNWELTETLPPNVNAIEKPQDWHSDTPKHNNLRRLLVNVSQRDTNSVWRETAAYSCMVLLDVPLSIVYTCSGGILAIPAIIMTKEPENQSN